MRHSASVSLLLYTYSGNACHVKSVSKRSLEHYTTPDSKRLKLLATRLIAEQHVWPTTKKSSKLAFAGSFRGNHQWPTDSFTTQSANDMDSASKALCYHGSNAVLWYLLACIFACRHISAHAHIYVYIQFYIQGSMCMHAGVMHCMYVYMYVYVCFYIASNVHPHSIRTVRKKKSWPHISLLWHHASVCQWPNLFIRHTWQAYNWPLVNIMVAWH